jgi:hypothetical protein
LVYGNIPSPGALLLDPSHDLVRPPPIGPAEHLEVRDAVTMRCFIRSGAYGVGNSSGNWCVRPSPRSTRSGRVDPDARIVHIDPIINLFPPTDRPDLAVAAAANTELQFEAWDLIAGYQEPELGGDPRFLDIMGVNF